MRAKNWVKELQRQASPNIVIALAGNKADLANKRALDFQVGPPPECGRFLAQVLAGPVTDDFSSFDRMHSRTQMITAYSSWKHQRRPL